MHRKPSYSKLDSDAFWNQINKLPEVDRFPKFVDFANFIIDVVEAGLLTRQQGGAAIAPAWSVDGLTDSGDMTIAVNLARELQGGGFESTDEAVETWTQMADIFRKYR